MESDMVDSDDDGKFDNDYEKEGTLDEDLLGNIGILCKRCKRLQNCYQKVEGGIEIIKILCEAN
jgi:hypothetical protein